MDPKHEENGDIKEIVEFLLLKLKDEFHSWSWAQTMDLLIMSSRLLLAEVEQQRATFLAKCDHLLKQERLRIQLHRLRLESMK